MCASSNYKQFSDVIFAVLTELQSLINQRNQSPAFLAIGGVAIKMR